MSDKPFAPLPQPWMQEGPARRVYDAIRAVGEVRFVGGCVRDALLGRAIKDIDLATPLAPDAVADALTQAGLGFAPTGIAHGTLTAIADGRGIEVTTLRRDVETDGRRAKVDFTADWREDAARRDLTINALSADREGRLYDYFGGLADLAAGRVRFVGDPVARIAEDYLRLLRFFRFHADYAAGDFDAAALTAAIAAKGKLLNLSGERLRQETLKILIARRGVETWERMIDAGIVAAYLPEARAIGRLRNVAAREAAFGLAPDGIRRLGALAERDAGAAIARKFKLSTREKKRLLALTNAESAFALGEDRALRRQIYKFGNALALDLLLVAPGEAPVADLRPAFALIRDWPKPALPIAGRDLVALGLAPGPAIQALLDRIEDWWVAGDFRADRRQCLTEAERLIRA